MLRIIQRCFNKCRVIQDLLAHLFNFSLYTSFELTHGASQRILILRCDYIDHRLCLGKIHLSIQKCALGKFSRFCRSGPVFDHSFQNLSHHKCSSMAVDLHGIFSRKSSRCSHHTDQNFIYRLFPIFDKSIVYRMALCLR